LGLENSYTASRFVIGLLDSSDSPRLKDQEACEIASILTRVRVMVSATPLPSSTAPEKSMACRLFTVRESTKAQASITEAAVSRSFTSRSWKISHPQKTA
jgi:hypothetical protein